MKVVHLTTTIKGGAGRAAVRSVDALSSNGISAELFSRNMAIKLIRKENHLEGIYTVAISGLNTFFQRKCIQSGDELVTPLSQDIISESRILKNYLDKFDLIHLHASYNFFLPENLIESFNRKPLVITLHDQRLLTGGCHYSTDCPGLFFDCANCPKVKKWGKKIVNRNKVENNLFWKKVKDRRIHLIAPSGWMQRQIETNDAFRDIESTKVFNCIPDFFFSKKNEENRPKNTLIYRVGVIATDINSPYKGINFFRQALKQFVIKYERKIRLVYISNVQDARFAYDLNSELISPKSDYEFINAIDSLDVVCVPSLIDNSPNVILESLARRVRVVASDSGGTGEIPELLNLRTFKYGDVEDFCSTLLLALENTRLDIDGHKKLIKLVSEKVHAQKLQSIYESMI